MANGLLDVAAVNDARRGSRTAVSLYEEASRIYAALVKAAPDNASWAAERENAVL